MNSRLNIIDNSSKADEVPEEAVERGIQNPRVIDLISGDSENQRTELVMIEFREDTDNIERLREIEEKYNSYLEYLMGGYFQAQYPDYEGYKISLVYEYTTPPRGQTLPLLSAMSESALNFGFEFVTRQSREIK